MQVGEQGVFGRVIEAQLLREDQRAAGQQGLVDALQQPQALLGLDKLQGEVQRHQGGRLELQGENVRLTHLHRQQLLEHRVLGVQVFAAALDHGLRVVHGNHPAIGDLHMPAQGLGHRAEGAAQVIQHAVRLGELGGEHAEVFDDGRVARHRTLDHVRKHAHHVFVKGEVGDLRVWSGEEAVGFVLHRGVPGGRKAGILAKSQA